METVDVAVVGAGQAGLSLSHELTTAGVEHLVLERGRVGQTWRDRWDDPQRMPLLIRIDVVPKQGPAWPTLVVAPREAPEAGCRAWDGARLRCAAV